MWVNPPPCHLSDADTRQVHTIQYVKTSITTTYLRVQHVLGPGQHKGSVGMGVDFIRLLSCIAMIHVKGSGLIVGWTMAPVRSLQPRRSRTPRLIPADELPVRKDCADARVLQCSLALRVRARCGFAAQLLDREGSTPYVSNKADTQTPVHSIANMARDTVYDPSGF